MIAYRKLLNDVLQNGEIKESRAGDTVFMSHQVISHNCLTDGFPALTGRKLAFKTMAAELDCFIHGLTSIHDYRDRGCRIWDANLADFNERTGRPLNADLGAIYGAVWRGRAGANRMDQLEWVLEEARTNPSSRRLFVTAWTPEDALDDTRQALPPCHLSFQLTINKGVLDLCFYMRSVDLVLGLPFDIASYALLQALIANQLGLTARKVTGFLADAHIYRINVPAAAEYLCREIYPAPTLVLELPPGAPVTAFHYTKAHLKDYRHGEAIATPMAV